MEKLNSRTIKVVDIFAGAGGASVGFKIRGGEVVLAIECDPKMMAIHQRNHPTAKHVLMRVGGNVKAFAAEIRAFLRGVLNEGDTWHLHLSPPCQTFSVANQTTGVLKVGEDNRTNLMYWSLDLVQELAPPSWTIEQVPKALEHIHDHRPWTKQARTDIVHGWECGAAVFRKRLFLSGGAVRLVRTVETIADAATIEDVLPHLRAESPHEIRVRGSKNTVPTVCEDGARVNRPIRWQQEGKGTRTLGQVCYTPMASEKLRLVHRTNPAGEPARTSTVIGPQSQWSFLRHLTADEVKLLQGFPADYDLLANGKHTLTYFASVNSTTPLTTSVSICEGDRIHAVGNSVVPLVTKAFLPRRSKRGARSDDEEREWVDPWTERAVKRRAVCAYFEECALAFLAAPRVGMVL